MSEKIKHFLFVILMIMLISPAIQREWPIIKEEPLQGAFVETAMRGWKNWQAAQWMNGSFQEDFNEKLEKSIGFRNSLIRINNQFHYSLFRQANAEGVIVGQHAELFEEDYIRAYLGEFFIGEQAWDIKVRQLKKVQDTLQKLDKTLLIVLLPGKGSYHTDRFPRKYVNREKKISNYDYFKNRLIAEQLNLLDLNSFFLSQKNSAPYPLFPKIGTHWSYYGAALAADTLLRHLQALQSKSIPEMHIRNVKVGGDIRHPDDDIWLAMNLLRKPPKLELAYPGLAFIGQKKEEKACMLTIGDSFYFNWLSDSVMYHAFDEATFWYYNRFVWDQFGAQQGLVEQLDLSAELSKQDIIMIAITERFHHNFAWHFDEQIFSHYFPNHEKSRLEYFENRLHVSNDQFMRLVADAKQKEMPLPERIRREAEFLMYEDYQLHPEKYSKREDQIQILMMSIRGTPDWYASIVEKAEQEGVDIEVMLRRDAEWIYENR